MQQRFHPPQFPLWKESVNATMCTHMMVTPSIIGHCAVIAKNVAYYCACFQPQQWKINSPLDKKIESTAHQDEDEFPMPPPLPRPSSSAACSSSPNDSCFHTRRRRVVSRPDRFL